jgi:prepilin-type N-terminal cleavage/methylation domain-containing protein
MNHEPMTPICKSNAIAAPSARSAMRRRAYTLVELLIVITVLGISAALLVPNIIDRKSMNAQAAVRLVIGDLCFAQSDALAHQEIRQVHFYANGRGYCIVRDGPTAFSESASASSHHYITDPIAAAGELGQYIVDFTTDDRFSGVTVESAAIDGTGRDLNFDTLGGTVMPNNLPGIGGTIVIASGTERYQIDIAPFTGKLTVRKL